MPILAGLVGSAGSLSGGFTLFVAPDRLRRIVPFLVSFAAGVFLGEAFLHLIPDAMDRTGAPAQVGFFTAGGILLFFTLENLVHGWLHRHGQDQDQVSIVPMILVGDGLHNLIDGILIAGSFFVSPSLGIATSLTILIHEIPQEMGDVGALIFAGLSPRRAVLYNFLSSLACPVGVLLTLAAGQVLTAALGILLPVAAGGFIYIATVDFLGSLRKPGLGPGPIVQMFCICLGIMTMQVLSLLAKG